MPGQQVLTTLDEAARVQALLDAQRKAAELFALVEPLVRPGVTEGQLSDWIADLGRDRFGIERHWHKRIVRAGPHTLSVFDDNPEDRAIGEDGIVFIDLGPVFEAWKADFGRTFVVGGDPVKLRLRADVEAAFAEGKRFFQAHPDITGAELFAYVEGLAKLAGWSFGGTIAGHLIGEFPHKRLPENATHYADPAHVTPMRGFDSNGRERHWILEIHFVDRARGIGGFFEELLTVG